MKRATNHYQLARHYQNTCCLRASTLQPPDQQYITMRTVLKLWLESVQRESVDSSSAKLMLVGLLILLLFKFCYNEDFLFFRSPDEFLCFDCVSLLKEKTVRKYGRTGVRSSKRKWIGTPQKTTPQKHMHHPGTPGTSRRTPNVGHSPITKRQRVQSGPSPSFRSQATDAIQKYQYRKAFSLLASTSKPAKLALFSVVQDIIRKEVSRVRNWDFFSLVRGAVDLNNLNRKRISTPMIFFFSYKPFF